MHMGGETYQTFVEEDADSWLGTVKMVIFELNEGVLGFFNMRSSFSMSEIGVILSNGIVWRSLSFPCCGRRR